MTTILNEKFHDRVPTVLNDNTGDFLKSEKGRFLLDKDITLGQFMAMLRKKNKIEPHEAIYVYCDNLLPKSNTSMIDLWVDYRDVDDNILYLTCSKENTFG
jgi:GABA(A) receptor-associated protein